MNDSEAAIAEACEKRGYTVLRNGWPDLLVLDEQRHRVFAIEVKVGKDRVSPAQSAMHAALARAGVPVHVASEPDLAAGLPGRRLLEAGEARGLRTEVSRLQRELQVALDRIEAVSSKADQLRAELDALCVPAITEPEGPDGEALGVHANELRRVLWTREWRDG